MAGEHQWVHAHPKVGADVREMGRGALATHVGGMQRRRLRSSGGNGDTAAVETGKWAREGRREARNMTALPAWKEEGLSSGDAARPSSAMAAMAARVREQQRGEGARERVSPVVHIGLARVEKQRGDRREARARGKGEGVRRPCKKTTSAKRQTRGERRGGQGGSRFGPSMGRISEWAKNEVFSPRPALHFLLRHSTD